MSNNLAKYEVLIEQYLRLILDISVPSCSFFLRALQYSTENETWSANGIFRGGLGASAV